MILSSKLMTVPLLLFGLSAFANFDLRTTEISIDGSLMPQQRHLILKNGETQSLGLLKTEIGTKTLEVTASDGPGGKEMIQLKFTLSQDSNGRRKILATPVLVLASGKEGKISEGPAGPADQPPALSIGVIAKKIP